MQELAQAIYDRFLSKLDSKKLSLLDYACGPGLVSFRLLEQGQIGQIGTRYFHMLRRIPVERADDLTKTQICLSWSRCIHWNG